MALYGMENFAFGTVSGTFDASQTTLNLVVTHGARFQTFPARAALWNIQDFNSAHDAFIAGDAEIIELVTRVGDAFTVIKRGQDGTSGITSAAGGIYQVAVIATRGQWLKVCRAPPDSSGPFDGILAGTPLAVADAVFRFVKDDGVNDCVGSIQGDSAIGRKTKLILGDTTDPDKLSLETQVGSPAQVGRLDMEGVSFLHLSSDGGLGILRAAGSSNDDQVHIGETLSIDKLIGQREGGATIAAGVLSINTQFVRVSAEGGPGADDLDELLVPLADVPFASRILVILEPNTTGHNITIRDKFVAGGSANIKLNGGGTFLMQSQGDKIALITDGVGPTGLSWEEVWRTPLLSYVSIRDEKSSGTNGGTFTAGIRTRDLNTETSDVGNLATLSSNQITLQPGVYLCLASAPAHLVDFHQLRLRNITDSTTLLLGDNNFADSGFNTINKALLRGRFKITAAKILELQHEGLTTQTTTGFGSAMSFGTEVYAMIEFLRVGDV